MRPPLEVADIFRHYGPAYRQSHGEHLDGITRRVMAAIEACRTPQLGGHVEQCTDCGHIRCTYNSCRNRHCPKCQGLARAEWLEARQAELLPVPYYHVVFTLPAAAAEIAFHNKRVVYAILFRAAAAALRDVAADPRHLGAEIGAVAVLHTWGQTLQYHPHLHCIVPGGGLSPDQTRWIPCRPGFLLPVRVLSRRFRSLFLARLQAAFTAGELRFSGTLAACRARRLCRAPRCAARGGMGGLRQAPVRRTRAGIGLSRPLHPPCRRGEQPTDSACGRPGQLHLEGLPPPRQGQDHDARRRRVHPAVPAACRAGRVSSHPPYRLPRQRPSHREAGAMPRLACSPDARSANAGELPRSYPSADRTRTRYLPRLWWRHAGAPPASALSAAAPAVLVRQLMTGNQLTCRTERDATPSFASARPGAGR